MYRLSLTLFSLVLLIGAGGGGAAAFAADDKFELTVPLPDIVGEEKGLEIVNKIKSYYARWEAEAQRADSYFSDYKNKISYSWREFGEWKEKAEQGRSVFLKVWAYIAAFLRFLGGLLPDFQL